jgi:hypothetical protein
MRHEQREAGLLAELPDGSAMEVSFVRPAPSSSTMRAVAACQPQHWVKAGVEHVDGHLNVGAVVTDQVSDWSTWPIDWSDRETWVRASRLGDAVTVRAHGGDARWQLVRLAPIDPDLPWAGRALRGRTEPRGAGDAVHRVVDRPG